MIIFTALGSTLIRTESRWQWSDGTLASGVQDMRPSWYYNFKIRNYADRSFVEVPVSVAHEEYDLGWVLDYPCQVDFDLEANGTSYLVKEKSEWLDIPGWNDNLCVLRKFKKGNRVYLIPIDLWDDWNKSDRGIIGARWDKVDEGDILNKARSLGWFVN